MTSTACVFTWLSSHLSASYVCLIYPDDDKLQGGAEVDIQFCALTERQPNISDKHKSIMHTYHRVSLDVI